MAALFRPAFERSRQLLAAFRASPLGDVDTSVAATLALADIFERDLPPVAVERIAEALSTRANADPDEVAYSLALRDPESKERPLHRGTTGFFLTETPLKDGPRWHVYPEYDAFLGRVRPRSVYLREVRWQPDPARSVVSAPPAALPHIRPVAGRAPRSRHESAGLDLDLGRLFDWSVSQRLGREADPAVFRDEQRDAPALAVSFVVDLSVSMEAPRPGLSPSTPLALAKLTIRSLIRSLEGPGVTTGIFGAHDGGGRPVTFYIVKDHDEPFDDNRLGGLSSIGVGGFRTGAILRHLDDRTRRLAAGTRHVAVLLTDDGSHYYTRGSDPLVRIVNRTRCARCTHRHRCTVEPNVPSTTMPCPPHCQIYLPAAYEERDLRHARAGIQQVVPLTLLLGTAQYDGEAKSAKGRPGWVRILSAADLACPASQLQRELRSTRAEARRTGP